ncbi:MAG: hypothetical protein ABI867_06710 [Kofleriaceae bacterium]
MRIAVLASALVAVSRISAAQPSMTPPTDAEQPSMYPAPPAFGQAQAYPPPAEPMVEPVKSESTATLLAIGATTAGFLAIGAATDNNGDGNGGLGLIGAGLLLIGPSAGHIYAGETGHAVKASLLRSAGVLAMLVGAISMTTVASDAGACPPDTLCEGGGGRDDKSRAKLLLGVGAAVYIGSTIYDLVDAGAAARRENRRHARAMMFTPTMMSTHSGRTAPAVSLVGRF